MFAFEGVTTGVEEGGVAKTHAFDLVESESNEVTMDGRAGAEMHLGQSTEEHLGQHWAADDVVLSTPSGGGEIGQRLDVEASGEGGGVDVEIIGEVEAARAGHGQVNFLSPPPSEQTEEPLSMGRVESLLGGMDQTSRRYAEVAAGVKEAHKLLAWLRAHHPEWSTGVDASRIADKRVLDDLIIERFARSGASFCFQARRAVEKYEQFVAKHESMVVGGNPYPPTVDLVAWFALWTLDGTRTLKRRTGKAFKGSSGKSRCKGLGYAATLFGAPFNPSVLKHEVVLMAIRKPLDAEQAEVAEAHMGVFVQFLFEEAAAGSFPGGAKPSEIEQDYAAMFAACGLSSIRSEEALRSKVIGVDGAAGGAFGQSAVLRCAGAKAARVADMKPFEVAVPTCGGAGFREGTGAVLSSFFKKYVGREFVFRAYDKARGRAAGAGAIAEGWSAPVRCADPTMVADMFYHLMGVFGFAKPLCLGIALRPYAFRHLLPDVTRALGWRLDDRMELGRWSVDVLRAFLAADAAETGRRQSKKRSSASLSAACANLYSRGKAAMERELELRVRACGVVRMHVAGRDWRDVVPVQREPPSFTFLKGSVEDELDPEEGGSDVE